MMNEQGRKIWTDSQVLRMREERREREREWDEREEQKERGMSETSVRRNEKILEGTEDEEAKNNL